MDHFTTRLATTLNYSAIADLHTSEITNAHAKTFQSALFTSRSIATASNNAYSSASALTSLPAGSQLRRLNLLVTDSELLFQLS
jgi:hypothetical protein